MLSIQYNKYLSNDFLEEFINYNNIMENFLLQRYFKNRGNFDSDKISLLETDQLISFSKAFFKESTFYPQSFRTSFFIQIFSILEYELKEICSIHFKHSKIDFSMEDLKGNSEIEKAKLYLRKAGKIDFLEMSPEWEYLNIMRKIRNRFVHSQGEINQSHGDWKTIYAFIHSNKNLLGFRNSAEYLEEYKFKELYNLNSIFMLDIQDPEFNSQMILQVKKFLEKLIKKLNSFEDSTTTPKPHS